MGKGKKQQQQWQPLSQPQGQQGKKNSNWYMIGGKGGEVKEEGGKFSEFTSLNGVPILVITNLNGDFRKLDKLVKLYEPQAIFHTGNFGFLDEESLTSLHPRLIISLIKSSSLLSDTRRELLLSYPAELLKMELNISDLSDFPLYLNKRRRFTIPIYTNYGSTEDVQVLQRVNANKLHNLHLLHPGYCPALKFNNLTLRLFGLGGAYIPSKLFDHGYGASFLAGGPEGSWTTLLQLGTLLESGLESKLDNEIRIMLTHTNPSNEYNLNQLASTLETNFILSPNGSQSCHTSYNLKTIYPTYDVYRECLIRSNHRFNQLFDSVWPHFKKYIDSEHSRLIKLAKGIYHDPPPHATVDRTTHDHYTSSHYYALSDINKGLGLITFEGSQLNFQLEFDGFDFGHRESLLHRGNPEEPGRHEIPWVHYRDSDQSPDQINKALINGEFNNPAIYFLGREPDMDSPSSASSQTSSADINGRDIPVVKGPGLQSKRDDQMFWFTNQAPNHPGIPPREDSPVSDPSSDEGSYHKPEPKPNDINIKNSMNTIPRSTESPVSIVSEDQEENHHKSDRVPVRLDENPSHKHGYPRETYGTSGQQSRRSSTRFHGYSRATSESGGSQSRKSSIRLSEFDRDAADQGEETYPNRWGIRFEIISYRGPRPPIWNAAKDRLVYIKLKTSFDPAQDIDELFHDFQDQIVRVFLFDGKDFIHVEIKAFDPSSVDRFASSICDRRFRNRTIFAKRHLDNPDSRPPRQSRYPPGPHHSPGPAHHGASRSPHRNCSDTSSRSGPRPPSHLETSSRTHPHHPSHPDTSSRSGPRPPAHPEADRLPPGLSHLPHPQPPHWGPRNPHLTHHPSRP